MALHRAFSVQKLAAGCPTSRFSCETWVLPAMQRLYLYYESAAFGMAPQAGKNSN